MKRTIIPALCITVALGLAACSTVTTVTSGHASYTVGQAASDMAAIEPASPFTSHAYDICLATYMFKYMSPSAVQAYINGPNFPTSPNHIEKAAEDNCVMVGAGQG
jgi:hypothetical protein